MKRKFSHLWMALLAMLGLGSCKSQALSEPAPGPDEQTPVEQKSQTKDRQEADDQDPEIRFPGGRMICLYGPPPAQYRKMQEEDNTEEK